MGHFFFLLSAETTLLLIFQLGEDLQAGWFYAPTIGESAILLSMVLLAILFGWISYLIYQQQPLPRFIKIVAPPGGPSNTVISALIVISIVMLAFTLMPVNPQLSFLNLIIKNKLTTGLLAGLSIQLSLCSLAIKLPAFGKQLLSVGRLVERYFLWILFIILVIVKIVLLTPATYGLLVLRDTYIYWAMAKQIFMGGLDVAMFHHYPPLYSAILSPIFLFGERYSLQHITVLNAFISSTAIFPLYLIARQFLNKRLSLAFTLLTAVYPFHVAYPALLFSENLYFPLFYWALYFAISYPRQQKHFWVWDLFLALSLTAMWLTRYMTLPLVPVFLIIWWLKPDTDENKIKILPTKARMIRGIAISVIILVGYGVWILSGKSFGVGLKPMLGFYPGEGGIPGRMTFNRLILWTAVSGAYLCLILAPVLHLVLRYLLSWKEIIWDGKITRWVIALVSLSGALMVEVTRHAWQANYNFPEPTKYVGRYVIYIAVMAWLTVFILLQNRLKTSLAKSVLTTVISIAAIILSYQAFYNPTWVSNDFLLNFRFVDAYSFSFFHWIFLTFLAALAIATAYFFFLGKNRASLGILIAGIFILNLVPWPGYFDKYVYFSTAPRHLDALLAFNETMFSEQTTKPVLVVSTGSNFYEEELEVRGFAPDMFRVRTAANDPLRADFCRTRLMIRYADGSRLAVVDKTAECKLDDEAALTSYRYNGMEYAVIKLPISK